MKSSLSKSTPSVVIFNIIFDEANYSNFVRECQAGIVRNNTLEVKIKIILLDNVMIHDKMTIDILRAEEHMSAIRCYVMKSHRIIVMV